MSQTDDGLVRQDPLSHRQTLVILEQLYDTILKVEQLRRNQQQSDDPEVLREWQVYCECTLFPQLIPYIQGDVIRRPCRRNVG